MLAPAHGAARPERRWREAREPHRAHHCGGVGMQQQDGAAVPAGASTGRPGRGGGLTGAGGSMQAGVFGTGVHACPLPWRGMAGRQRSQPRAAPHLQYHALLDAARTHAGTSAAAVKRSASVKCAAPRAAARRVRATPCSPPASKLTLPLQYAYGPSPHPPPPPATCRATKQPGCRPVLYFGLGSEGVWEAVDHYTGQDEGLGARARTARNIWPGLA